MDSPDFHRSATAPPADDTACVPPIGVAFGCYSPFEWNPGPGVESNPGRFAVVGSIRLVVADVIIYPQRGNPFSETGSLERGDSGASDKAAS